jgi:hypothetical protein
MGSLCSFKPENVEALLSPAGNSYTDFAFHHQRNFGTTAALVNNGFSKKQRPYLSVFRTISHILRVVKRIKEIYNI